MSNTKCECWRGHPPSARNQWGRCLLCHKYGQRMKRRGLSTIKRPMYELDRNSLRKALRRRSFEGIAAQAQISIHTLSKWMWNKRLTANVEALNRVHLVIGARQIEI